MPNVKQPTFKTQLGLFLALALAVLWGLTFFELLRAEKAATTTAEIQAQTTAQAFAEHTQSTIKRIDLILNQLTQAWQEHPQEFAQAIRRFQQDLSDVSIQASVADRQGWMLFSNLSVPKERINIADREHFRVHLKARRNQLYISKPVQGRVSGKWSIQFTRPLLRDGQFDGIIILSVSPELFTRFQHAMEAQGPYVTDMVRKGGELMSRAPQWQDYMGQSLHALPYLDDQAPVQGHYWSISQLDGVKRIFGYYRLPEYEITLVVGLASSDVLKPVRSQSWLTVSIASVVSLVLLIMAGLLLRSFNARVEAEQALHELNHDLEERVQARTEELLHANANVAMAASVFHHTLEGIMITDERGMILSVNPAFSELTGYSQAEAVGRSTPFLRSERHDDQFYRHIWSTIRERGSWRGELWNRHKDGSDYLVWLTINPIQEPDGSPPRYVSVFHDITELRRKDERIHHLAFHDALTNLPNRALLHDRLGQAIERAQREQTRLSVTFIDLDRFKIVNDTLGHDIGDLLLQEVAQRIKKRLRSMDTVARMGGDEFVILTENLKTPDDCATLAQALINEISRPMELLGHQVQVGASLGSAFFPDDGLDATELMKRADTAMYAAKAAGRNTYRFYHAEMGLPGANTDS